MLFGGIYVGVPHGFCLFFRYLATAVLVSIVWFVVLFTGSYPAGWHAFNVGTLRWALNVQLYMSFMTDDYPKFTGKELEAEELEAALPVSCLVAVSVAFCFFSASNSSFAFSSSPLGTPRSSRALVFRTASFS